jgi:hypothetical protein
MKVDLIERFTSKDVVGNPEGVGVLGVLGKLF